MLSPYHAPTGHGGTSMRTIKTNLPKNNVDQQQARCTNDAVPHVQGTAARSKPMAGVIKLLLNQPVYQVRLAVETGYAESYTVLLVLASSVPVSSTACARLYRLSELLRGTLPVLED